MNLTRLGPQPLPLLQPMEQRDGERRRLKKESDRPEMAPLLSPPHEPDLVAADVSRRICLLSRQRISADSRRRLRFRGSTRESFRGNLSPRGTIGETDGKRPPGLTWSRSSFATARQ